MSDLTMFDKPYTESGRVEDNMALTFVDQAVDSMLNWFPVTIESTDAATFTVLIAAAIKYAQVTGIDLAVVINEAAECLESGTA